MESVDMTEKNIEKIESLFPNCITEALDENGKLKKAINFETLKQMLSKEIIDGDEAYEFTWVGKKAAIVEANKPIRKTLRPCIEESVNWNNTENIYIEGDNLDALKLLQESYLGKVDMIYIDPPYNTGSNLIYRNNFYQSEDEYSKNIGIIDEHDNKLFINTRSNGRFHSDWCSMIYSRLLLARNLLSLNGMIALTIDDSEIENITAIMNEIFGEENHLATIVVKNNPSGRSTVTGAAISHEYVLFYGKNNTVKLGRLPRSEKQISRYKESDNIGRYEWVNFRKHGGYKEDAPKMYYPIFIKKDCTSFRIPKLSWNTTIKEYDILEKINTDEFISYPIDENGRCRRWKWSLERALLNPSEMKVKLDKSNTPAIYIKSRMKEEGMLPLTVWDETKYSSTEYGTNYLKDLMGKKYFDYPKSIYAVMDCIRLANINDSGIILDFFSGSATTAHAVFNLNIIDRKKRKFIMVQLPEKCDENSETYNDGYKNICEVGKERIRRAGKTLKDTMKTDKNNFDTGFRVFKVDSTNMNNIFYNPSEYSQHILSSLESNIKSDRSDLDLLFGCLLEWGLPLSLPYNSEEIEGYTVHNYNNGDLIACFDEDIPDSVIKHIAKKQPLRAIFRDGSFASSPAKINVGEIFKSLAPDTRVKVI